MVFTRVVPWLTAAVLTTTLALVIVAFTRLLDVAQPAIDMTVTALAAVGVTGFVAALLRCASLFIGSASRALPALGVPATQSTQVFGLLQSGATNVLEAGFFDPNHAARQGLLEAVQADVKHVLDLLTREDQPLVIFIDDLDRCSPSTISDVVEAVNLFMTGEYENCIFVLGLDASIVAGHIEANYRQSLQCLSASDGATPGLGWRFLDKFVQLPLHLPRPHPADLRDRYVAGLISSSRSSVVTATRQDAQPIRDASARPADASQTGVAAGVGRTAALGATAAASNTEQVNRLLQLMATKRPGLDTIGKVAREAEREVYGSASHLLRADTLEAANLLFSTLYSDEASAASIYRGLTLLGSTNPREIKRFVNLYRFYAFIGAQKNLQNARVHADEVAKLAALIVGFPQLIERLLLEQGEVSMLLRLEKWLDAQGVDPSHRLAAQNDSVRKQWLDLLEECQLLTSAGDPNAVRLGLRLGDFLIAQPRLGVAAVDLL